MGQGFLLHIYNCPVICYSDGLFTDTCTAMDLLYKHLLKRNETEPEYDLVSTVIPLFLPSFFQSCSFSMKIIIMFTFMINCYNSHHYLDIILYIDGQVSHKFPEIIGGLNPKRQESLHLCYCVVNYLEPISASEVEYFVFYTTKSRYILVCLF